MATSSRSSSGSQLAKARTSKTIDMTIRLPTRGYVFMPFPRVQTEDGLPREDKEIQGELEIWVPPSMGPRRCKAIRVGVKSVSKLVFNGKIETDTLYEAKVEVRGGTSDSGVVLQAGIQRFAFNVIVPGHLAPQDYYTRSRIDDFIFAELEGEEEATSGFSWFRRTSTSSPQTSTRSLSPQSPSSSLALTISRQESALPSPPNYDGSKAELIPWLTGNLFAERPLVLIYNPDPSGGVSSLDSRGEAFAPGVGPVSLHYSSEKWTIAAPLSARLDLLALSPATTVFFVQTSLVQHVTVISVRDSSVKTTCAETPFTICSLGAGRPSSKYPGREVEAIWRGTEAGGTDNDELVLEGRGYLPNDYHGRPSTLEGVTTPINVTHVLRTQIFFSVDGEDALGKPLAKGAPGELRYMQIQKPVIVPSCFLVSNVLDLPVYSKSDDHPFLTGPQKKCTLCGTPAWDKFCKTCPLSSIPHARHDLPPELVGDASGTCPLCGQTALPMGVEQWRDCACGMLCDEIISRMKRVCSVATGEGEVRGRRTRSEKASAEGRRMVENQA